MIQKIIAGRTHLVFFHEAEILLNYEFDIWNDMGANLPGKMHFKND